MQGKALLGRFAMRTIFFAGILFLFTFSLASVVNGYISFKTAVPLIGLAGWTFSIYSRQWPVAAERRKRRLLQLATAFMLACLAGAFLSDRRLQRCSNSDPRANEIIAACSWAIHNEPKEAKYYIARGLGYVKAEQTSLALEDFRQAAELVPRNPGPLLLLGLAEQDRNRPTSALNHLDAVLHAKNVTFQQAELARAGRSAALLSLGRDLEAESAARAVLQSDPSNAIALRVRALLLMGKGEFPAALTELRRLQHDRNDASTMFLRGIAQFYAQDPADAVGTFAQAQVTATTSKLRSWDEIWLRIAESRANQLDPTQVASKGNEDASPSEWPAPLLALYRGRSTAPAVLDSARIGSADDLSRQLCDADFYLGEFALLKGAKENASALFEKAANSCSEEAAEFAAARAELKRMKP